MGAPKKISPPSFLQDKNRKHPLQSTIKDDFCSLSDELSAIKKCFKKKKIDFNSFNKSSNEKLFPRLYSGLSLVPEIIEILSKFSAEIDLDKVETFGKFVTTIAVSTALINLMQYLHETSIDWQSRFKLGLTEVKNEPGLTEVKNEEVSTHYGCVKISKFLATNEDTSLLKRDNRIAREIFSNNKYKTCNAHILCFDQGGGKGRFISLLEERHIKNPKARIISMDYTMRAKVVMNDILEKRSNFDFVCIHNADRLLDLKTGQPINIFTLNFIRQICDKQRTFDLLIVVRDKLAADLFEKELGIGKNVKSVNLHRKANEKNRNSIFFTNGDYEPHNLAMIDRILSTSRWANLVMQGASNYFEAIQCSGEEKKSFFRCCDDAIKSRSFSVDRKYLQSIFCGVIIEERQRLTQLRLNIEKRKVIVAENIILKWMFSIGIAVDSNTIHRIPEILQINKDYPLTDVTTLVDEAIKSLLNLALIYELSSKVEASNTNASNPRYVLHGVVRQYLAQKRGLPFDRTRISIPSSVTLSMVLMDGGPMLDKADYSTTRDLFESLISNSPEPENRIVFRSAYALLKGNLYAQCVMRAGLVYGTRHASKTVLSEHLGCLARLRTAAEVDIAGTPPPILYRYDRFWLMNELGVVRFLQGNYHDAAMMFRNILDAIDNEKENDVSLELRVLINLAFCLIERANFGDAMIAVRKVESRLEEIGKSFNASGVKKSKSTHSGFIYEDNPERRVLLALAEGCKAQIELLTAHLDEASASIRSAFQAVDNSGTLGMRSWLHQIDAAISIARNEFEDAIKGRTLALAAARGSQRPDLILSVETSEVEFLLSKSGYSRESVLYALTQLNELESTAVKLGSYKLRVEIGLIRSRALLTIEQVEGARTSIIETISLAQLNGMRLKRMSGLILLVALMALRGEDAAASRLLSAVKLSVIRSGYVRAILDIELLEQSMNIDGGIARWAGFASDFSTISSGRPQ